MEIMFQQLTANSGMLLPTHVKRDLDRGQMILTHPTYEGFDMGLRIDVVRLMDSLKIFPWILRHLDQKRKLPAVYVVEPAAPAPTVKRRRKH